MKNIQMDSNNDSLQYECKEYIIIDKSMIDNTVYWNKGNLTTCFIEFLKESKNTKLNKILESKKMLRFSHSVFVINDTKFVITHIIGQNDRNLIKLATSSDGLGFPRGWAMVWNFEDKTLECQLMFLPKFDNDDRNGASLSNIVIQKNIREIKFSKKMSGSLMGLGAFMHKGQKYLITTAKNSSLNNITDEFTVMLKDVINKQTIYQTEKMVEYLLNNNSIFFEGCSNNYSVMGQHGALYKESLIIALIISKPGIKTFAEYVSYIEAMYKFIEFGLPVENNYTISINNDNHSKVLKFFNGLDSIRNDLDNITFEKYISIYKMNNSTIEQNIITTIHGTFIHEKLSNVLEGLIFWIFNNDGSSSIIKWKLPNYTIQTMLFRTLIEKGFLQPNVFNKLEIINAINWWVKTWVTDKDKHPLWFSLAYKVAELVSKTNCEKLNCNNYLNILETIKNNVFENIDIPILDISTISDRDGTSFINQEGFIPYSKEMRKKYLDYAKTNTRPNTMNLLSIGLQGTGKTTIFRILASLLDATYLDQDMYNGKKNVFEKAVKSKKVIYSWENLFLLMIIESQF